VRVFQGAPGNPLSLVNYAPQLDSGIPALQNQSNLNQEAKAK